jgi:fermentation-respiration switch protein FrsA (DUF1100 family)
VVLAAGLLLVLAPLQQALLPLPSSESAVALGRLWAQPAGALGVLAGLVVLTRGESFLIRLGPASRFRAELWALVSAGGFLLLPILVGALLAGASPSDVGRSAPAILTALLHSASLALLLLHPTLTLALRIALFGAATWLSPALGASAPSFGPLVTLLDAHVSLRDPSPGALGSSLAASASLVLAALQVRR